MKDMKEIKDSYLPCYSVQQLARMRLLVLMLVLMLVLFLSSSLQVGREGGYWRDVEK